MNTAVVTNDSNRKSLMLDTAEYDRVSALAKRAGVARPLVIIGLLDMVDEPRLISRLHALKAAEKAESAELAKRRKALTDLAANLSLDQISALSAKLGF